MKGYIRISRVQILRTYSYIKTSLTTILKKLIHLLRVLLPNFNFYFTIKKYHTSSEESNL